MSLAIVVCNGFPQALTRLAGSDPPRHKPPLDGSFGTKRSRVQESLAFLSTHEPSVHPVLVLQW